MTTTFLASSNSAFKGMAQPEPPSPPPQQGGGDAPAMSSTRVRLSYEYDYDGSGVPSPHYYEGQQQHQPIPHEPASTTDTNVCSATVNVVDENAWLQNMDDHILRLRQELTHLREDSRTSAQLLENKARSGLSPAFTPGVQNLVTTIMSGSAPAFSGPLSGRTPMGLGNDRMPTTPGGGDFFQTPRTAGGGAANLSTSRQTKGALGFIKDEALRLRDDLEQQAGLLDDARLRNQQLQDEMRELAGERERLQQDLAARERQMRELQAAAEEKQNEDRERLQTFQVEVEQLRQEMEHKHREYDQLYEFSEQARAKGLETETRLQTVIEELQRTNVTGLQQGTDAAVHAEATLVYQEEQLLVKDRQLEELRQQAAMTEEAARAAAQALEEEVQRQREAAEAYRAEAQQLRWEREQQAAALPPAFATAPALSTAPAGPDVEAWTQALAASEASKDALETDLRQQQEEADRLRAEVEQLQQSRTEVAAPEAAPREEEEATRRGLEEEINRLQEVADWLRAEVEQLQREREEVQAGVSQEVRQREDTARQALEGEVQGQRELMEGQEAELEQLRQENAAMAATVTTALASTAPHTAPGVGQHAEGQLPPPPPMGDEERQALEATIRALENTKQQLDERLRGVEAELERMSEVEAEKRELMLCVDVLKDALEQERESHQQRLEETVTRSNQEVEHLVTEVQRLEAAIEVKDTYHHNVTLMVLTRMVKNIRSKQQLKAPQRAFCRWLAATNAMQREELETVREKAATQALEGGGPAQVEELKQLEAENKALLQELQREPPTRGGVMATAAQGGTCRGASGPAAFLSFMIKLLLVVGVFMVLQHHFAFLGEGSHSCYIDSPRITM